jgi:hypothetical protein
MIKNTVMGFTSKQMGKDTMANGLRENSMVKASISFKMDPKSQAFGKMANDSNGLEFKLDFLTIKNYK